MNNLIKAFEGHDVRFVAHPEEPWMFGIVATDFASVLESKLDAHRFARSVNDEYKSLHNVETFDGSNPKVLVIWEPGIYQLLACSRNKKAKPFQHWLFTEALPAIRATGSYSITPQSSQLSLSPADLKVVAQLVAKELESTTLDFQPTKKAIDASLAQAVAQLKDYFLELVGGIGHKITVDLSSTQKHRMDVIDFLRQLVENQSTILGNQKAIYDLLQNHFNPPSAFELEYKGVDWEAAFKRHEEKRKKEWEEFVLANGGWAPPIEQLPILTIAKKLGYNPTKEQYEELEEYMKAETRGLGKPKEMCRDGSYFTVLTYHDAPYIHDFVKQFFEPETEESRKKRFSPFKFK